MLVLVSIGKAAAVHQHRVVQHRPLPFLDLPHPAQHIRKLRRVKLVDPRNFLQILRLVLMVRKVVVPVRHPDLRKVPVATVVRQQEARYPGAVRPESHHHQIQHETHMLLITHRDASRRVHAGIRQGPKPFRPLNPAFEFPHRSQVLVEFHLVVPAKFLVQRAGVLQHKIQKRFLTGLPHQIPLLTLRSFPAPKQPLKQKPRIGLGCHRHRFRTPGKIELVRTRVPGIALPGFPDPVAREFQRRDSGQMPDPFSGQLVHRNPGPDIRTGRLFRAHRRQHGGRRPGMIPGAVRTRSTAFLTEPAHHLKAVPERFEGFHGGPELVIGAETLRKPAIHVDPVGHVQKRHPQRTPVGRHGQTRNPGLLGPEKRLHRLQKRQPDSNTESAKKVTPVHVHGRKDWQIKRREPVSPSPNCHPNGVTGQGFRSGLPTEHWQGNPKDSIPPPLCLTSPDAVLRSVPSLPHMPKKP